MKAYFPYIVNKSETILPSEVDGEKKRKHTRESSLKCATKELGRLSKKINNLMKFNI